MKTFIYRECRDNHMGAIFALTRIVDNVRTCSCGFPGSFDLNKIVDSEFCQIFKEENGIKKDHDCNVLKFRNLSNFRFSHFVINKISTKFTPAEY